ncbi:hypothetical protein BKG81_18120 [Mycobacteroides chelonae]|nr:hypothetical protein BKG81_18120 [Mycobacteroides chelonae]
MVTIADMQPAGIVSPQLDHVVVPEWLHSVNHIIDTPLLQGLLVGFQDRTCGQILNRELTPALL